MILYNLTNKQEHDLRVKYVQSKNYNREDYYGYRNYAVSVVPGLIDVGYYKDDRYDTIETLIFEDDKSLAWFMLSW